MIRNRFIVQNPITGEDSFLASDKCPFIIRVGKYGYSVYDTRLKHKESKYFGYRRVTNENVALQSAKNYIKRQQHYEALSSMKPFKKD